MKTISNSEITSYNECTRKHHYAYGLGVAPKTMSPALYRGSIGHEALAVFYRARMVGLSVEESKKLMFEFLQNEMKRLIVEEPENIDRVQLITELRILLEKYVNFYGEDNFRILSVEEVYKTPFIQGEVEFGSILDVLIEYTSGPFRGDLRVMDHKFVYNFKSEKDLAMDGQLPKYIKTLQANGFFVHKAVFNQLRYRSLKNAVPKDIFLRVEADTDKTEMETIWAEQKDTAIEIWQNPRPLRRTLAQMICKYCDYYSLCKAEMGGKSIEAMLITDFKKRERPLQVNVSDD